MASDMEAQTQLAVEASCADTIVDSRCFVSGDLLPTLLRVVH